MTFQERVKAIPGIESATFRKRRDRLEVSNGWALVFGGTMREEASRS